MKKRRPLTTAQWHQWRKLQASIEEEEIDREIFEKMHGKVRCEDCGTTFTPGASDDACPFCHGYRLEKE